MSITALLALNPLFTVLPILALSLVLQTDPHAKNSRLPEEELLSKCFDVRYCDNNDVYLERFT